jgi:predicted metal-dependent phosphoesterase TrpH
MFLGDFHIHSTFSDGRLTIPELIDFYGSRGFGVISITDHLCETKTLIGKSSAYLGYTLTPEIFPAYLEKIQEEAERAWRQYRMVVIPGVEFTKNSLLNHRSAHIVGIGMKSFIPADLEVSLLSRAIRKQGALAIAAHPVWTRRVEKQTYYLWDRREKFRDLFDAWEVASGSVIFDEVAATDLPKIASSDLHLPRHINSWKTVFNCEKNPEAILEAIRDQKISFRFYKQAGLYLPEKPSLLLPGSDKKIASSGLLRA